MGVFTPEPSGAMVQPARLELVARDTEGQEIERLVLTAPRVAPPEPAQSEPPTLAELGRPRVDFRGPQRWRVEVTGEDPYVTTAVAIRRHPDADRRVAEVIRQQLRDVGALPSPDRADLPPDWTARLRDVVSQGERLLHGWERWSEDTRREALDELDCRIGELS